VSRAGAAPGLHAAPRHARARARPRVASLPRPGLRQLGYAILCVKLAAFAVWSAILFRRFSLTPDFAQYQQAWYLIAHGHLDPFDTVGNFPFWRNHAEFIMWPLALLYWAWPHGVTLLWAQDACVIGAEMVAFGWICDIARRNGASSRWLAAAGLVLLVVSPWSWWSVSFDFHAECVAVLFLALLARGLMTGRRRALLWIVPLVACGDVAGTYLFGLGLGLLIGCRGARLRGAALAATGVAAVLLVSALGGNAGSGHGFQAYAYLAAPGRHGPLSLPALLAGLAAHPGAVAAQLWAKRVNLWANLGSSGLLGLAFVPLLPLLVIVTVANDLFHGILFSEPIFQDLPVYVLLPVGTVSVLGWLASRRRRLGLAVTAVVAAQAIGWAAVWAPRTPYQWLRVPPATAAQLAAVQARIPGSAAVFASQGVVGRFSQRLDVRPLNGILRLRPGQDWFVFAPWAGIETQQPASAMTLAGELAGPLHARLVLDTGSVWAFKLVPGPGLRRIRVPDGTGPLPAWTAPGAAGRPVLTGPPATWHVSSAGRAGYVADRLEWRRPPGRYEAAVTLSAAVPVNVEVWDNTGNVLLARRTVPAGSGIQTVRVQADAATGYRTWVYGGWGPFRATLGRGPRGQRIEVRVWTPGGGAVSVYRVRLTDLTSGRPGASAP
jgi:hypothetical protein